MSITHRIFDTIPGRGPVTEYMLENAGGAKVGILDMGGTITDIIMPDRDGKMANVHLGFDDTARYGNTCGYIGALIGRVGNRIGGARFTLDGQEYILGNNDGPNNLHGGPEGFEKRMWKAEPSESGGVCALKLTLESPDGDQGFPGTLKVEVTYTLDNDNALGIYYRAETDRATLCNLTNHAYFNLDGHDAGTVEDLELQVFADYVNEVDPGLIPTGRLTPSKDVPYGFVKPTRIGDVLDGRQNDPALKGANGVDFNYCMGGDRENKVCAELYSPKTGRVMTVETDQPGVQVYTGQGLNETGRGGVHYGPYAGICLETQHYPDAIHQPQFHSIVLRPEDRYYTYTIYRFGVR